MTLILNRAAALVFLSLFAWLAPAPVMAEAPVQLWAAESPGHTGPASGQAGCTYKPLAQRAMAIDAGGNSYVTGCSSNGANNDYLTVKYDPSGAVLWIARYNGTGNGDDRAYALAVDASGNVTVTGQSRSSSGNDDYATVQYNSAGVQQWVAIYNGTGNSEDVATALAVDASGNVTVTGKSINSSSNYDYATVQYNSAGAQQWVNTYNGTPTRKDQATAIAVDASGNVTVTGTSSGSSSGDNNYVTIQYNSAGAQQWLRTYNGTATAIAVDASGNVTVTGRSSGNYATVKYDSAGVEQWVAIYTGTGNNHDNYATALAVDVSGNVTVTGYSYDSGGSSDYATVQYNSAGAQLWVATYNGTGNGKDYAYALAVDASGNVTVTGYSLGSSGGNDYATVQYNSAGTQLWAAIYNSTGYLSDQASALAVDASGNVTVTGSSYDSSNVATYATVKYNSAGEQLWVSDPIMEKRIEQLSDSVGARKMVVDAAGNSYVAGRGFNGQNDDYRVVKFDASGTLVWSATYNDTDNSNDVATALAVDASGNVTVTGYSQLSDGGSGRFMYRTVQYNSAGTQLWVGGYYTAVRDAKSTALVVDASGNVTVTGYSYSSSSNYDYVTVHYNSAGVQQWVKTYNGTHNGADQATALAVDASGNVTVTGSSFNGGNTDYATVKYNSDGVQQWVAIYDGNRNDVANALAVDANGNVTVTGQSRNSSGNYDYVTVQYNSAGAQKWVRTYNGTGNGDDVATALAVDASGNVTVTGQSIGSSGGANYATVQYNSAGVQQWVKTYNGTGNGADVATALAVDASGNVIVTGYSSNGSNTDYATVKYNSAGVQQWVHRYDGGRDLDDTARAIAVDTNGHITIAGTVHDGSGYDRIGVVRLGVGYAVTASAGANGSITPASQAVVQGGDAQFTVTPASGYHAATVIGSTCSPVDLGGGIWKAANITQDCAVTATFAINQYTLTYSADANGSIDGVNPQTVNHGSDGTSVSAVPNANYHFVDWSDGSTSSSRTDNNVVADIDVTASFAIDKFTVTASAFGNGSITPVTQSVAYGSDADFIVTPSASHHVVSVSGDTCTPADQGGGMWIAPSIQAGCAVIAAFEQNLPPTAMAQDVDVPFNTAKSITLVGNDANPGGPFAFTYARVSSPVHGTISAFDVNTGALTYTPTLGYSGADAFTFTVATINGTSAPATVTIAVVEPQLVLSIHDGRDYARYGQVVDYVVTLTNTGDAANAVPVAFTLSAGFDGDSASLTCTGANSGASCEQDGTDPLHFTITLPANRSLTWLVSVPVRFDAEDESVDLGASATGTTLVIDTNTLVVFRDGFDLLDGDGTQSVPAIEDAQARAILDDDTLHEIVVLADLPAIPMAVLIVHDGGREVRVDACQVGNSVLVRLLERAARGQERATQWSQTQAGATLTLGSVATQDAPRAIVLIGAESPVALQ